LVEGGLRSINNESNGPHLQTGLRVICTIWEWGKTTCRPRGLIPICRKQSRNVETVMLIWMIMKGRNPEHLRPRTSRLQDNMRRIFRTDEWRGK